jgi:hypothetical protein
VLMHVALVYPFVFLYPLLISAHTGREKDWGRLRAKAS